MALKKVSLYLPLVALSLAAPSLCMGGAITINGTCELGNCSSPKALPYGSSTGQKFTFNYTFPNTDTVRVFGDYSASSSSNGTAIAFNVRAIYLGNATNTPSGNDLLTVDLLQDYHYPFNLNGTYSYSNVFTIGPFVAPASSVETDLFYEGQDVGQIGPFTGQGHYNGSASSTLSGLTHPLTADYRYTFYIAAGSVRPTPGAAAVSSDATDGTDLDGLGATGSGTSQLQGDDQ